MRFLTDSQRHLVCVPYSVENLHEMAKQLGIKRCWFHRDHYDVPKGMIAGIRRRCQVVRPRQILAVIRGEEIESSKSLDRLDNSVPVEAREISLVGR